MLRTTLRPHLNTNNMNEEKVIIYVQQQIMDNWWLVMRYDDQLRVPSFEDDQIIHDCIANAKERIEYYTLILNKLEQ
jgi:hypothetical protein